MAKTDPRVEKEKGHAVSGWPAIAKRGKIVNTNMKVKPDKAQGRQLHQPRDEIHLQEKELKRGADQDDVDRKVEKEMLLLLLEPCHPRIQRMMLMVKL